MRRRVGQQREASRIQRQNPVPPGRYWIDIPQEKFKAWDDLVERNKGALQIDHHETTFRDIDNDPLKGIDEWFIFFVTAPISWPAELPPPNTAPDWVAKRSDVYQRPEDARKRRLETTAEAARQAAEEASQWAREQLWPLVVIGGLIYYFSQQGRR